MGWCSATEIIDAVIDAADEVTKYLRMFEDQHTCCPQIGRDDLDDKLRPIVARVAKKLREEDWDCQYDSPYLPRFPREMFGFDAQEYADWQEDQAEFIRRHPAVYHVYPEGS